MNQSELTRYISDGIQRMLTLVLKQSVSNPRESLFVLSQLKYQADNAAKRKAFEADTIHVPAFLIASITTKCNLHCHGCYARANGICVDEERPEKLPLAKPCVQSPMKAEEWDRIFSEAAQLGVSFILLAGGEPFLCPDVLAAAGSHASIICPVFTNGTVMGDTEVALLEKCRNLIPILSVEATEAETDECRGAGTWNAVMRTAAGLQHHHLLFGVSVTLTAKNYAGAMDDAFISLLRDAGARVVFYVEYTAADHTTREMEPDEAVRFAYLVRLDVLRTAYPSLIFIAFPGDEAALGGCLAAGRGFFHINPYGGAEPCPFSPFSDRSLKNCSLLDAISSPLFHEMQVQGLTAGGHDGGCVLARREEAVRDLLSQVQGR